MTFGLFGIVINAVLLLAVAVSATSPATASAASRSVRRRRLPAGLRRCGAIVAAIIGAIGISIVGAIVGLVVPD